MLEGLGQKPAGATAGIIDRFAGLRIDGADNDADDLARGEELAAVIALVAHLQEQALIDLAQREHMRAVRGVKIQGVDAIEHVEQVLFGVDAGLFDAGQSLADDLLARRRVRVLSERFQMRDQIAVHEAKKVSELARFQCLAFGACGRRPVAPAIGGLKRRCETGADGVGFVLARPLLVVEHAQEQNPGQFRHILHRAGAFGAAKHVTDRPDGRVERGDAGRRWARRACRIRSASH
jgi:hypothetical protein